MSLPFAYTHDPYNCDETCTCLSGSSFQAQSLSQLSTRASWEAFLSAVTLEAEPISERVGTDVVPPLSVNTKSYNVNEDTRVYSGPTSSILTDGTLLEIDHGQRFNAYAPHCSWVQENTAMSHSYPDPSTTTDPNETDAFTVAGNTKGRNRAKKYVCTWMGCDKRFERQNALVTHMNIHTEQKPYACPVLNCGKVFNVRSNMRRHLLTHKGSEGNPGARMFTEYPEARSYDIWMDMSGDASRTREFSSDLQITALGASGKTPFNHA